MRVRLLGDSLVSVLCESESETDRLGEALASLTRPGTVAGLDGPLGSGKTRLVRAWAQALGADPRAISSPTFVLVHEYEAGLPVYHFDAYRLGGPRDLEALGAGEYFEGEGLSLVEWASKVAEALPPDAWRIVAEPVGPEARRYSLSFPGARGLAEALA